MQTKLGVYLVNTHDRQETWNYITQLQPKAIRVLDPSTALVKRIYDLLPNTIIYPRFWSISEDQERYKTDPEGLANDHINFWKNKIAEFESNGMNRDRFVTVSQNEPTIWSNTDRNSNYSAWWSDMQNVYRYNLAYNLKLANGLGKNKIKSCLLNFSVGHCTNKKDGEPPYWEWALPLVEPTLQYGHKWCVHEYFGQGGIQDGWRWLCGRVFSIPFDVPIVIGETSLDRYVNEPNVDQRQRGWQSVYSKDQIARELNSYIAHLELDDRIEVAFPFLTDYADNRWASFDLNPAYQQILREKQVNYDTYLPVIINTGGGTPIEPPKPDNEPYKLQWPPLQPLTQFFNDSHSGVDVGIGYRTPIYAIADGDVAWVDFEDNGYGNYVRVYHKHLNAHSFGAHFDEIVVKQGDRVTKGQLLGYSGHTGRCDPPGANHLHFEIRLANADGSYKSGVSKYRNAQVDPIAFFAGLDSAFGHIE